MYEDCVFCRFVAHRICDERNAPRLLIAIANLVCSRPALGVSGKKNRKKQQQAVENDCEQDTGTSKNKKKENKGRADYSNSNLQGLAFFVNIL
mmetsp:Transcript_13728/g.19796  ORF Transcript_13728/g.19796 Transcript_13728/m.19796 type:complete len:93 (+) Transcript_13728:253-531(+)